MLRGVCMFSGMQLWQVICNCLPNLLLYGVDLRTGILGSRLLAEHTEAV